MRKRLIVALLMVFLSFAPVYAGHSVAGGICDCENPASHTLGLSVENHNDDTQQGSVSELGLFVLFLTALTLKYRR